MIHNINNHDTNKIKITINTARKNLDQPTLIYYKTTINFNSPNKQGKEECHNAPLDNDKITLTHATLN